MQSLLSCTIALLCHFQEHVEVGLVQGRVKAISFRCGHQGRQAEYWCALPFAGHWFAPTGPWNREPGSCRPYGYSRNEPCSTVATVRVVAGLVVTSSTPVVLAFSKRNAVSETGLRGDGGSEENFS